MFQIKIHYGQVSTERKKTKLNLFCNFIRIDLPLGYISQREERLKEKLLNIQIQNPLGFASRRTFTEKRKMKKNVFDVFYTD
jgi:hypothetical protein